MRNVNCYLISTNQDECGRCWPGTSINPGFQHLFWQEATNADVFSPSIEPLVDLFMAGFNTCLIITGETGAGKAHSFVGDSQSGLMQMIIENLFSKMSKDERFMYDSRTDNHKAVQIQACEIYNELVKDLLQVPGVSNDYLDVEDTATKGPYVRNLLKKNVGHASEGTNFLRQAWERRTRTPTDFGPSSIHSSIICYLELSVMTKESSIPNKSRLTVVVTPGIEKLSEDSNNIRLREGPNLSKSLVSLSQLVTALANQPFPDRFINYTESRLTYLLRDELGGNCKTRVLFCLKQKPDSTSLAAGLRFCTQLAQVKNFPILNDPFAQQLITQWRARVLHFQNQIGLAAGLSDTGKVHDIQDELRRIQTENLGLKDKNERLHQKLEDLQGKFGNLASSKTDLSTQLLMTEEEKLKVSKTLVEMQIENNKLKEEGEEAKYDLTNRILQLENALMEKEGELERFQRSEHSAKERLSELEKDRKDLADEYVALKSNYLALNKDHGIGVEKNQELCMELLNLVNAKAIILRRLERMNPNLDLEEDPDVEVARIKAVVKRLSSKPGEDIVGTDQDRETVHNDLFGDLGRHQRDMDKLRSQFDDDARTLDKQMKNLKKESREARNLGRERQKKISELNAQVITLRNDKQNLETVNNRLQHKLKDVNDEFRSRLVKYVEDIADYVDHGGHPDRKKDAANMKKYLDSMMQDLRKAHKVREEQLSSAAQNYKGRLDGALRKHEELLVAYRELRQQVEDKGFDELDLGPDEHHLNITDKDLTTAQQKEILRLKQELGNVTSELEALKIRGRMGDYKDDSKAHKSVSSDADNMKDLRRQLAEFTHNTQEELEQERAGLLSRNAVLEQEVTELQAYIDTHLARYKDEIMRLRQMLNMNDSGGFVSPGANNPHNHRKFIFYSN
ncbi:hypothetical protein CAPTEDRAFT_226630 [Capitella teleta]|uniref:Kinesin motor domain-containing protein n=2 Tax=Capitella teleta TaxID=283909 RepID=R7TPL0_CAPTE|nr:hypothetical protein CAPTEDRAFT_226630 [Capitella teleta]|eukprot:ELT95507.1 hypothetical protein CAPTEDRAFT_226630 [Capitella teleta]